MSGIMIESVKFDAHGLVTAIAQDADNGQVLMVAYMNAESLRLTLESGIMTYWSRSRKQLWKKGESSGHTQRVVEVRIDCDGDALLFRVRQEGGACHMGYRSCFYRKLDGDSLVVDDVKVFDPDAVYKKP